MIFVAFPLTRCSILVIEDEALIALHIADAFECAGARVVTGHSLQTALQLVEADNWSAAVLDQILGDENSSRVCKRLVERQIPFVLYSGRDDAGGACDSGVYIDKPGDMTMLVKAVEDLVRGQATAQIPEAAISAAGNAAPAHRSTAAASA